MKKIAFIAFALFAFTASFSATNEKTTIAQEVADTSAVIVFEEQEFNFGTIKQGDKVNHVFTFKNTGTVPLKLESVRASCGCTTPFWPKEPIMPGATSKIDVTFNSAGKLGQQSKSITIRSNANPAIKVVYLKGKVDPKDEE